MPRISKKRRAQLAAKREYTRRWRLARRQGKTIAMLIGEETHKDILAKPKAESRADLLARLTTAIEENRTSLAVAKSELNDTLSLVNELESTSRSLQSEFLSNVFEVGAHSPEFEFKKLPIN